MVDVSPRGQAGRIVLERSEAAKRREAERLCVLAQLHRHRATFIEYARHRLEDEDWHGLSDAANDLRELDVEIRITEAAAK